MPLARISTALPLIALLLLSACATPLQQCLNAADRPQKELSRAIETAELNIARGYAVHRSRDYYTYWGTCHDYYKGYYLCPKTGTRIKETPVAIDVGEERKKLAALRKSLPGAQARAQTAAHQCRATYPE